MASSSIGTFEIETNSERIHVTISFDDGNLCQFLLQPDVAKRLENGDSEVISYLRKEYEKSISRNGDMMKRSFDSENQSSSNSNMKKQKLDTKQSKYEPTNQFDVADQTFEIVEQFGAEECLLPADTFEVVETLPEQTCLFPVEEDIKPPKASIIAERGKRIKQECKECGCVFLLKQDLMNHMQSHLKQKTFICTCCDYNTTEKIQYIGHIITEHPDVDHISELSKYQDKDVQKNNVWTDEAVKALFTVHKICTDNSIRTSTSFHGIWRNISVNLKNSYGYDFKPKEIRKKWQSLTESYNEQKGQFTSAFPYSAEMKSCLGQTQVNLNEVGHEVNPVKNTIVWTSEMIELLIREYEARFEKFHNYLILNKVLWQEICMVFIEKGYDILPAQLDNKWKMLLRKWRGFKLDKCNAALNLPLYYFRLQKILKRKEEVEKGNMKGENVLADKRKGNSIWSVDATDIFLSEFKILLAQINCTEITRISMWQELSSKLSAKGYHFSPIQLHYKWQYFLHLWKTSSKTEFNDIKDVQTLVCITKVNSIIQDHPSLGPGCEEAVLHPKEEKVDPEDAKTFEWSITREKLLLKEYQTLMTTYGSLCIKRTVFWQKLVDAFETNGFKVTSRKLETKWQRMKFCYRKACQGQLKTPYPHMKEMSELLDNRLFSFTEENPINWTSEAVSQFIEEYKALKFKFDDPHIRKKTVWPELSASMISKGFHYTDLQCQYRFKKMTKDYRSAKHQFLTKGKLFRNVPHFKDIMEIINDKMDEESLQKIQDQLEQLASDGNPKKLKRKQPKSIWTDEITEFLVKEYGTRLDKFNDVTIENKFLWLEIEAAFSNMGYNINADDIEAKWNSLFEKFKRALPIVSMTNYSQQKKAVMKLFPSFDKMLELFADELDKHVENTVDHDSSDDNNIVDHSNYSDAEHLQGPLDTCDEIPNCEARESVKKASVNKDSTKMDNEKESGNKLNVILSSDDGEGKVVLEHSYHSKGKAKVVKNKKRVPHREGSHSDKMNSYFDKMEYLLGFNTDNGLVNVSQNIKTKSDSEEETGESDDYMDENTSKAQVIDYLKIFRDQRIQLEKEHYNEVCAKLEQETSKLNGTDDVMNYVEQYGLRRLEMERIKMEKVGLAQHEEIKFLSNFLKTTQSMQSN